MKKQKAMYRITKLLLLASIIGMIAACGSKASTDDKQKQLEEYEAQLSALKAKIANLKDEMGDDSTRSMNTAGQVPVTVKVASPERFEHFIEVAGSLEAVNEAYISPETGGRIKTISVREGDRVSKGQVLARLNSEVTENSVKGVKTQLELATVIFTKQQELWRQKIGSEVDFLQAKSTKEMLESQLKTMEAQLNMAIIRSPISGIVEELVQKEGELAAPGMPMMRIINLDELYVKAEVAESHLPALSPKDPVIISFPTWPDLEMKLGIDRIGSAVHSLNRTVTVQAKIRNTGDRRLRPNLMASMRFMDFSSDTAILVPSICIKQDINGQYLYTVIDEEGRQLASKVYIQTGLTYRNTTMVTKGLAAGDKVVVQGYNLVTDATEVRL